MRVDDDGVGIMRIRGHRVPVPRGAPVFARHHPDQPIRDDDASRPVRVNQDPVDIALARIGIDRQLPEALAEIV